ncbi:MAB_1171c family putative transporter [Streptomyces sp. NPDC021080]|uniref:MAB_1171c family putative transporter n=1 Tax=Streptomyces sp. NPDC021080 TaxID=3365110 RepID=UPI00378EA63E
MTAPELADQVGTCSVVTLWIALVWRAVPALRLPNQRGLWVTVFTATTAVTLFQPKVVAWLTGLGVDQHTVSLTRNLVGVLSAGLVLLFIVDSTRTRHLRIVVITGLLAALGALLILDTLTAGQEPTPVQAPATSSCLYWLILVGAHLVGDTAAVVVCWPYSLRTDDRDLMWSLRMFAVGSVLAVVFWCGYLITLFVHAEGLLPYLSIIISVHGFFRAASLLVPTATACVRSIRALRTVWRLWPLWHDLVVAVPQVALAGPRRSRVQEVLLPRSPLALQAHRQIIETYDALLELQQYTRPDAYERAHRQAGHDGSKGDRLVAAALAGALRETLSAKRDGAAPSTPCPLPGMDGGSPTTLLALARMWASTTGTHRAAGSPGPARSSGSVDDGARQNQTHGS